MEALYRWSLAVTPHNSTFWANYFWLSLTPDWMQLSGTSPWARYETRQDWSIDDLDNALTALGVNLLSGGGSCPVQVEAVLSDGHELYFRARGQGWYCEVEQKGLCHDGLYGQEPYAAGYMPLSEVFSRIKESLELWGYL